MYITRCRWLKLNSGHDLTCRITTKVQGIPIIRAGLMWNEGAFTCSHIEGNLCCTDHVEWHLGVGWMWSDRSKGKWKLNVGDIELVESGSRMQSNRSREVEGAWEYPSQKMPKNSTYNPLARLGTAKDSRVGGMRNSLSKP
jgi:hypothetical protein